MKKLISERILQTLLVVSSPVLATACSPSESSTTPDSSSGGGGGGDGGGGTHTNGTTTEQNALALAYPGTLALAILPDGNSAALRLTEEATGQSYSQKVEDADKRLRGEGACFAPGAMGEHKPGTNQVDCYEFDSDMNPSTFADRPNQKWGTLDGSDGDGQACMVTFAKSQVDEITHQVDRALAMVQGLICVGKKDAEKRGVEVAKPEADADAIDLKDIVNAGLPADAPIKFSKAQMSAVTSDSGTVSYITEIAITNPFGKTDTVVLQHIPATEEGGDESGILSFQREPLGSKAPGYTPNDPNQLDKKYDVMSISYQKSKDDAGADHMVAELTRASINQSYHPLDDEGKVNFAALPEAALNSDINRIKYVAFDLNPATGAGDLSYWMNPGGALQESARGFVFSMTADDADLLSGCGISGATSNVSIRKAAVDSSVSLKPSRFWHPRAGQNTSPDKDARYTGSEGNLITEQCFKQDATSGKYVIDSAKTTSTRGYDVKTGTDSSVRPPERPPEPKLPPKPLPPKA